jgi:hypothetical protein
MKPSCRPVTWARYGRPPDYFKHPFDVALAAEDAADKLLDVEVFDRHANDVAVLTDGVGTVPAAAGFPVPVGRHIAFGASTVWHCSLLLQTTDMAGPHELALTRKTRAEQANRLQRANASICVPRLVPTPSATTRR